MQTDEMGVVGERDVVLGFQTLGMKVVPAETKETVTAAVVDLARQGVPVILITERAAQLCGETMERFRNTISPVLIPIPGSMGTDGYGMKRVRNNVEKAIGADILFEKEG